MFFDVTYGSERQDPQETSRYNPEEANFVEQLIISIFENSRQMEDLVGQIGIVSPYDKQCQILRRKLNNRMDNYGRYIEINTVDGFQGSEKDIIIFSCVRTDKLGFLKDLRRLNVAITRPKFVLWIVGKASCLRQDPTWSDMLDSFGETNYREVRPQARNSIVRYLYHR